MKIKGVELKEIVIEAGYALLLIGMFLALGFAPDIERVLP